VIVINNRNFNGGGFYPWWFYGSFFYGPGYYGGYYPRYGSGGYDIGPGYGYASDLNGYVASLTADSVPPMPPAAEAREEEGPSPGIENENQVMIDLLVPAQAEVWFDGEKTTQSGIARQFYTPPLVPGHDYKYDIRARWRENGREVTRARTITIRAGDHLGVNFLGGPPKSPAPPAPRP
jgi:uncharacterized protein (TIGR03000 family)